MYKLTYSLAQDSHDRLEREEDGGGVVGVSEVVLSQERVGGEAGEVFSDSMRVVGEGAASHARDLAFFDEAPGGGTVEGRRHFFARTTPSASPSVPQINPVAPSHPHEGPETLAICHGFWPASITALCRSNFHSPSTRRAAAVQWVVKRRSLLPWAVA